MTTEPLLLQGGATFIWGSVLFFGLAAVSLVIAIRTPWRPDAIETHLYRYGRYMTFPRIRRWGRARILAVAAVCAFIGWRYLLMT